MWYARPKTVTHPSTNRPIVRRSGIELTTKSDALITRLPRQAKRVEKASLMDDGTVTVQTYIESCVALPLPRQAWSDVRRTMPWVSAFRRGPRWTPCPPVPPRLPPSVPRSTSAPETRSSDPALPIHQRTSFIGLRSVHSFEDSAAILVSSVSYWNAPDLPL